jgi:thermitase
MRPLRPLIAGLVTVMLVGLVTQTSLTDRNDDNQTHIHHERFTADQEMRMKQQILEADADLTGKLCIRHCILRMEKTISSLNSNMDPNSIQKQLDALKNDHTHMKWASWQSMKTDHNIVASGAPSSQAKQLAKTLTARGTALNDVYQSPIYNRNGHPYALLAVPSPDKKSMLMVEVEMQAVTQVKAHQTKNLRMNLFPSKGKTGVKTIDNDSLRPKNVTNPEENEGTRHFKEHEVIVKFNGDPSIDQIKSMERTIDGRMVREMGPVHLFRSNSLTTKQLMKYFQDQTAIEYVEPHYIYITNEISVPNDLLYQEYQWNLPIIRTEQGWDITRGKKEVVIAVVDTGVDLDHPEFKGKLVEGMNFIDSSKKPYDDVGHGTHVAGIIGAATNNGEGIAGITWLNKIMPIKVLDSSGSGNTYDVAQGIIWAVDHGAKVINLSLGNYAEAQFLHDAVKYAYERDVILIAATGNDNTDQPGYPAAYPEVFAVGATDDSAQLASFSNYGSYVDVTAPGVSIPSTYPENQYAALSGTSMASPHVAGLAGLIRSAQPELQNKEVMELIRATSDDLGSEGHDPYFGQGQINVASALQEAAPHLMSADPPLIRWAQNRWDQIRMNLFQQWGNR